MNSLRIDAHHHLWQRDLFDYRWQDPPELAPLRCDFLPCDLEPLLQDCNVARTIVVQTQHDLRENDWALQLADRYSFIAGVVGWVDLASPDCEAQLLAAREHPKFVGVRHVTHDEPDDDFIVRPEILRGLKTLEKHRVPFDLLFYVKHLRHVTTLATALPELPMVIDHLAKPRIKAKRTDGWIENFRAAAKYPNVFCKLSGMITEADWQSWQASDLRPYVDAALEAFGPERCMFGSDWPVCLLAGSYRQVHDAMADCVAALSADEQFAIWGGTAQRYYQVPDAS
jgi:L-fuconolactonase